MTTRRVVILLMGTWIKSAQATSSVLRPHRPVALSAICPVQLVSYLPRSVPRKVVKTLPCCFHSQTPHSKRKFSWPRFAGFMVPYAHNEIVIEPTSTNT
jgi:hypothetical protein